MLVERPQSTKASPTTGHSDSPSNGMSGLSAPHNPATTGARNKCSSSWYCRISLDHATNYQIGRAKQNAKEVWAHHKPLLGNLINCYLARTVPVPRNIDIEHCSHLLSYLFVYVFFFSFSYFCNSAWPLYQLCISETRLVSHFILLFGEGWGGGCHVTVALQPMYFRHVFGGSQMIVCEKYETRNLTCIVGFHMTLHYVVAQRSQSIDWWKKQHAYGIEKYRALKYSPLILKLKVTFTKRLSFKTTFKGHSIIMYLNHASTKDVTNTQNQC